jgi:hypothetical protein
MKLQSTWSLILVSVLPAGAIAVGCSSSSSPDTASKGQMISCTTDPGTGAILRCDPPGSDDGSGASTCEDIDEDGDGEPHDVGDDSEHQSAHGADDGSNRDGSDDHGGSGGSGSGSGSGSGGSGSGSGGDDGSGSNAGTPGDRDGDGIPDERDCDDRPGEDHQRTALPYDVRPAMGAATAPIADAFAARGGQVPAIVSITMAGGTWRLAELQAGTSFVVTQDDCNHAGNRATGRDRVFVTWKNADQTTSTDHLDIRYCK